MTRTLPFVVLALVGGAGAATAAPVDLVDAAVAPRGPVDPASRAGPVGLPRMSSADAGAPGTLRLGVLAEFFRGSDFLVSAPGSTGDRHTRLRGAVSVDGTPLPGLELYGALLAMSNRNRRVCASDAACNSEVGRTDPEVIRTSAALTLGGKLARRLHPRWALGGEAGVRLLPSVAGLAFDPGATSGYAHLLGSARLATGAVPVAAHLSAGFFLDNSPALLDQPAGAMATPSSRLVSAFAYGVARSRAQVALGVEAPWREPWSGRLLRPSVEYHLDVVTAKGDAAFTAAAAAQERRNRDQHWASAGVDVEIGRGSMVGASVDLAIRSAGFRYGTRLPPYNVVLGLTQNLDLGAPRIVTRVIERPVAAPPRQGFASGRVVDQAGTPIDGALVAVEGRPRARVATDPDGGFRTAALVPGPAALVVTAPRFERAVATTVIGAGRDTAVTVRLTPLLHGLTGRLLDPTGNPVAGTIRVTGARTLELPVDAIGGFEAKLPAGRYQVFVSAENHLRKRLSVDVPEVGDSRFELTLRPRPAAPRLRLDQQGQVIFARPLAFATGPLTAGQPTELASDALATLDELIDVLLERDADQRRVHVETRWDRSLSPDAAQRLTDAQAEAVVAYLSRQGIPRERVQAVGLGSAPVSETQRPRRRVDIRLQD